jgi:threonine/homoserine/homoserine lactone efflux protein
MFTTSTLITFVVASIAIILAPGPAQALVLARTISDGRRAGIFTALGLNIGTIIHAFAAAVGISAVLATSALAFALVKYLGAAYLVYLGLQALGTKPHESRFSPLQSSTPLQLFAKAVATGILNPKVALFFLAFLPQFVDPQRGSVFAQFAILGCLLAILDIVYETMLVLIASVLRNWLTGNERFAVWRQRVTGAVLIGLGVRLALLRRD